MAEEKKPYKLKDPIILIPYALILGAILSRLVEIIEDLLTGAIDNPFWAKIWVYLMASGRFLSTVASIFFATGIVYATIQLNSLRSAERQKMKEAERVLSPTTESGKPRNLKWERVEQHIGSDNPNDWRLAILEADIILDEMLTVIGYHGETIGDKLKSVEKSDFTNVDLAWEAHKVRNQIAHEGSDFLITQREAKRIIQLYRRVFEEFRYI